MDSAWSRTKKRRDSASEPLEELIIDSPKQQLIDHMRLGEHSFEQEEGPIATLKTLFDNVVTALKNAFSKEDSKPAISVDKVCMV